MAACAAGDCPLSQKPCSTTSSGSRKVAAKCRAQPGSPTSAAAYLTPPLSSLPTYSLLSAQDLAAVSLQVRLEGCLPGTQCHFSGLVRD